jgi:hypothetical protein
MRYAVCRKGEERRKYVRDEEHGYSHPAQVSEYTSRREYNHPI